MITLTDANFKEKVLQSEKLILVDFWAAWCGPCRTIAPILEALAKECSTKLTIGKLDIEANPNSTKMHDIRSIPTLIFFKDGREVERIIGLRSSEDLRAIIEKLT